MEKITLKLTTVNGVIKCDVNLKDEDGNYFLKFVPFGYSRDKLPKKLAWAANCPIVGFTELVEEIGESWFLGLLLTSEATLPRYRALSNVYRHRNAEKGSIEAESDWLNERVTKSLLINPNEDIHGRKQAQYIDPNIWFVRSSDMEPSKNCSFSDEEGLAQATYLVQHAQEITRAIDLVVPKLHGKIDWNLVPPAGLWGSWS